MKCKIKLFGALKKLADGGLLWVDIPEGTTAAAARIIIKQTLQNAHPSGANLDLIDRSALADTKQVIGTNQVIQNGSDLSLLPPVCGG